MQLVSGHLAAELVRVQTNKRAQPEQSPRALRRPAGDPEGAMPVKRLQSSEVADGAQSATIFVIDDDDMVRDYVRLLLELEGRTVEAYASSEAFLAAYRPGRSGCLVIDLHMPGMSGIELLERLAVERHRLPAIMITGRGDVKTAVQAMKVGAVDFIEKPFPQGELIASIDRALERTRNSVEPSGSGEARPELVDGLTQRERQAVDQIVAATAKRIAGLTSRQRQVMDLIVAGHLNKEIAWRLGISQRTVENHRATVMKKTGAKSLPDLIHLVMKSVPTASVGQRGTATRVDFMTRRSQSRTSVQADG
jgi:two-component system CheB/CheR fusion protein